MLLGDPVLEPITGFSEASASIVAAITLHPPLLKECKFRDPTLDVIALLEIVEAPTGVDWVQIFAHSSLYYKMRVENASSFEVRSKGSDHAGFFLGQPFFAHPRIRPNTVILLGIKGGDYKVVVGSSNLPDENSTLFT